MKRTELRIMRATVAGLWLATTVAVAATSYTNDTNWGGADLTLQEGDVIAGVHTNIGHFAVAVGATATVQPYGPVLSDPVYSNEVVVGYATTNTYGWARIYAVSGTVSGTLSANAAGYPAMLGPGAGNGRAGAAYGGRAYGQAYGSPDAPLDLGSGGGTDISYPKGGAGGGAIYLETEDTLTVPGTVSANGQTGTSRSGGGSGGSIWLRASQIAGNGTITCDAGSASTFAIPAAGGRVAFDTLQNNFRGIIRAKSGAGRVGFKARNGTFNFKADPNLDLVISNDIALPPGTNWVFKSLTVTNGATFEVQSLPGTAAQNYTNEVATRLRILGDVTVAAGSALSADGQGYWMAEGPGAGTSRSSGAYGGRGGFGDYGASSDGMAGETYGAAEAPDRLGSGGGNDGSGNAGGGALILDVAGQVAVEGTLSANGARSSYRGGGGSGGSVWIKAGGIRGNGSITVNGGLLGADSYSAGGGGGRIALETTQNAFVGIVQAQGQPSNKFRRGLHGTFNFKPDPNLNLVISNDIALPPGTNWVFKSLTITHGATFEIQSLPGTAAENYTNEVASHVRILGDVVIASGSSLSVAGLGYLGKQGPGASSGVDSGSGGGGYGGAGGAGYRPGGDVYGAPIAPNRLGSGGGNKGNGGGALILEVAGKVIVQGTISAMGDTLGQRDGGGSGGSLWIKADRIEGDGKIIADGGNCGDFTSSRAGGGGGGRIAIEVKSDRFTGEEPGTFIAYAGSANGAVTVAGGDGGLAEDGTAGTFYLVRPRGTIFMVR